LRPAGGWRVLLFYLAAALALGLPAVARPDVAVLVPGYLSGPRDWRASGVSDALEASGWRDGGDLQAGPRGVARPTPLAGWPRTFYTVAMPSEAPLLAQARALATYLDRVRTWHPGEGLILVGHSAGGVVARLYMVQNPDAGVVALVTIASPHLGTDRAGLGALAGQTPLAWFAPLFGAETLNRSQGLYRDLLPENPQGVLFWLNRQPHPPAEYACIVRTDDGLTGLGDLVVPDWSQDLNNVIALRGRARRVPVADGHGLGAADGRVLVEILEALRRS
jgi:pimeloyl-ACP methyl ester carboxylesterase